MSVKERGPEQGSDGALPLVRAESLTVHFNTSAGWGWKRAQVHALDDVSLSIVRGKTVGVVGESGSGKSTLGRAILQRVKLTSGWVEFDGCRISDLTPKQMRSYWGKMQCIFQDPYGSLNPRRKVGVSVAEPLLAHGRAKSPGEASSTVSELLRKVGLRPDAMGAYPSAFSGGQLQRISIARALALDPSFIVADEPVSALDVSIQAQVINLLMDIQDRLDMAYLFISHDISVVKTIADRIAVMYAGQIVEEGPAESVVEEPVHPYTEALVAAVPTLARRGRGAGLGMRGLGGEPADPISPPSGCRFRTRCPLAEAKCAEATPPLERKDADHLAACWMR